jgi:hypothetical protein
MKLKTHGYTVAVYVTTIMANQLGFAKNVTVNVTHIDTYIRTVIKHLRVTPYTVVILNVHYAVNQVEGLMHIYQ